MDINTLIDSLTQAVKTSDAIEKWSRITYEQSIAVFENMDPHAGPVESDCPAVIFYPVIRTGGEGQEEKVYVFGFSCVVHDPTKETTIHGVVRFNGGSRVEALRGMVVDAIQAIVDPMDLTIEAVATEYDTIKKYPFVSTRTDLTMVEQTVIGSDYLE